MPTYLARNAVWRVARLLDLVGGEVIVPAYHHGVEIAALLHAGVAVSFARVDGAARLDLEDVEARIGPRTRALYLIHYAGFPQDTDAAVGLVRRHGLKLIEDCALALFSRDGARPLGSAGDAAVFCFYKTLPVAHGGALVVKSPLVAFAPGEPPVAPALAATLSHAVGSMLVTGERTLGAAGARLRGLARTTARGGRAWARHLDVAVGTQGLDPAALGLGMSALMRWVVDRTDAEAVVRARRANWLALHAQLGRPERAVWNRLPDGVCPLFYGVRVDDKARALARLAGDGIQAIDFWNRGHESLDAAAYPEARELRRSVVELPCHQDLGPEEVLRVAQSARRALEA